MKEKALFIPAEIDIWINLTEYSLIWLGEMKSNSSSKLVTWLKFWLQTILFSVRFIHEMSSETLETVAFVVYARTKRVFHIQNKQIVVVWWNVAFYVDKNLESLQIRPNYKQLPAVGCDRIFLFVNEENLLRINAKIWNWIQLQIEYKQKQKMWFFLLIIGMVASYVSARRWGYQLYQFYRPRIAYAFRTRKLPASETDDDVAKKKFDLESVIFISFHLLKLWRASEVSISCRFPFDIKGIDTNLSKFCVLCLCVIG